MTIGDKIVDLRKKHNLTQEKLAEMIGISRGTLVNWENGSTSPDLSQSKKLAEIFNISLDDIADTKISIESKNNVLKKLIGKTCYIDADLSSSEFLAAEKIKVIDVSNNYLKIEVMHYKKKVEKLVDIDAINSISYAEEGDNK